MQERPRDTVKLHAILTGAVIGGLVGGFVRVLLWLTLAADLEEFADTGDGFAAYFLDALMGMLEGIESTVFSWLLAYLLESVSIAVLLAVCGGVLLYLVSKSGKPTKLVQYAALVFATILFNGEWLLIAAATPTFLALKLSAYCLAAPVLGYWLMSRIALPETKGWSPYKDQPSTRHVQ